MSSELSLAELEEIEARHLIPSYARLPLAISSAADVWLHTVDGRKILDCLSGLGVTSLGHAHPAVTQTICDQAGRLLHTSNLMHLQGPVRLAQRLAESSLGGAVFFTNSGAEANEAAIKFARRHKAGGDIVSFLKGFHGRTYGSLSATPQESKQQPFAPLVPGFRACEPTIDAITAAVDDNTAAVLVEAIQGESGVYVIDDAVLHAAREVCDRHGALLIFDEVQTGVARTGTMWRYQGVGVEPDAITAAKAIANGLPIGALIVRPEHRNVLQPGDHGSTFAGGPLQAAAAHAVFDVVTQPEFLERVIEAGERFADGLSAIDGVDEVRGAGLMIACELSSETVERAGTGPQIVGRLLEEQNLLVNAPGPSILRLLPPLTISNENIDDAVERIAAVLGSTAALGGRQVANVSANRCRSRRGDAI